MAPPLLSQERRKTASLHSRPKCGGGADVRNGATIANNGSDSGVVIIKPFRRLEVSRVQILRTMREEVEA